jgi:hypothetical protein
MDKVQDIVEVDRGGNVRTGDDAPGVTALETVSIDDNVKLREDIRRVLELRVANERMMLEAIDAGVKEELATEGSICPQTVKEQVAVMKSMTPVESMFKVSQLLDGKATESVMMTKEEISKKLLMVVDFSKSGALDRMEELGLIASSDGQDGEVRFEA